MSELNERRWAVLSERGREETGMRYEEAAALIARLRGERLGGLCVITDEAASHLPAAKEEARKSTPGGNSNAASAGAKPRRSRKKKNS